MRGKLEVVEAGVISIEALKRAPCYPSDEALNKGPKAVIECPEEIPCNPCERICKKGAIVIGDPITNLPKFLPDKCNGCGRCIPICPGLCIFVVDKNYSEKDATISFPHEYLPLPEKGDVVDAVNRKGEVVCKGKVIKVLNPKGYNRTSVVTISVPKEFSDEVRGIKLKTGKIRGG